MRTDGVFGRDSQYLLSFLSAQDVRHAAGRPCLPPPVNVPGGVPYSRFSDVHVWPVFGCPPRVKQGRSEGNKPRRGTIRPHGCAPTHNPRILILQFSER